MAACRQFYTVKYIRLPDLFDELLLQLYLRVSIALQYL
jgi:hypothetical protein